MSYYTTKILKTDFDTAVERITKTLQNEGFGIISVIPIHEKIKEKLDIDFKKYVVLGACNPGFAYQALQLEDKIGVLLPCNVIVQQQAAGEIEISAINPMETMQPVNNEELGDLALEVSKRLAKAIENLKV
jgi:uncharacterized protein (DUF302 family)